MTQKLANGHSATSVVKTPFKEKKARKKAAKKSPKKSEESSSFIPKKSEGKLRIFLCHLVSKNVSVDFRPSKLGKNGAKRRLDSETQLITFYFSSSCGAQSRTNNGFW